MSYYIFSRSKDFATRAYDLKQTDVLVVLPGATMNGTFNGGGLVRAVNATVQNNGTIRNVSDAVELSGSTLVNRGSLVSTTLATAETVSASGGVAVIVNTGTIQNLAQGEATRAIGASTGRAVITNHGEIANHGGSLAIAGAATFVIENDGQITGGIRLTGNGSNDTIVNVGRIDGGVDLGSGDDRLDNSHGTITGTIVGGLGNDTITGGDGRDVIYGDTVTGSAGGNDTLYGGAGDDSLFGGYGDDTLQGNQGDDLLQGNQGNDYLHGGQGNDQLFGGQGDDILNGGVGDDVLTGGAGHDTFVFAQNFGHDTIADFARSGSSSDTIQFQPGTFASFADVQAHEVQQGANVLITLNANDSVLVLNTTVAALTADHFLFG